VSPVKYKLGFYIPKDDILHSHCREHRKSYIGTYTVVCVKVPNGSCYSTSSVNGRREVSSSIAGLQTGHTRMTPCGLPRIWIPPFRILKWSVDRLCGLVVRVPG
jgi:hypothetical protein